MKVMKFGGSCLQSREGLERMIELIRTEPRPLVIVLSALKGVTDKLIAFGEAACTGEVPDVSAIERRHVEVLETLDGEPRAEAETRLAAHFADLRKLLSGIAALGEAPLTVRDRLLSFGERLSVILAAAHLASEGIPAQTRVAEEAGILTTDEAGDARILDRSRDAVMDTIGSAAADTVHVVAGFIGRDGAGRLTTLGRGGSDTTATFLASVLGGPAVLWKDTSGLLTGDPRVVAAPQVIERVHYLDALELAHYGLPAIAAKALHPARRAGVTIEIRSFLSDAPPSIVGDVDSSALAITCVPEVVMIDLVGDEATVVSNLQRAGGELAEPRPGRILSALARFLDDLGAAGVELLLLTHASPAGETTVGIQADHRETVESILANHTQGLQAQVRDGLAAVSLIGSGMRGRIGFAASVFSCLAAEGVNIESIAQTASERNISVVVKSESAQNAVRALHKQFVEDELRA
jgi:aspartate kinase